MNNKLIFLVSLISFFRTQISLGPFFILLIFSIPIYLMPKLSFINYLFLIIIFNLLYYYFLRTLYKKGETYLKLFKLNFLKFILYNLLCFDGFLFLIILFDKILTISSINFKSSLPIFLPLLENLINSRSPLPIFLPPLIFYSILFFLQLFIIYKNIKLSELEDYDELLSKFSINLKLSYFKSCYYGLSAVWIYMYISLYISLLYNSYTFLYIFAFIINPFAVTLSVISLIEGTTYYVRKAFLELKKLQDKII